jgi:hypothetical protein
VLKDGTSTLYGGDRYELTLGWLFELTRVIFRGYLFVDNQAVQVYLKKPADFVTNTLDVTDKTLHLKQFEYQNELQYLKEIIDFHPNNIIDSDEDWLNIELLYKNGKNILRHDLKDLTTRFILNSDMRSGGMFMGLIGIADVLVEGTGYKSGLTVENSYLSPANLLANFYRDYISTKRKGYSIAGIGQTAIPTHFRPIIKYPDFVTQIADPTILHSGLKWQVESGDEIITRVARQSTSLIDNLTTFESHEYKNEIN